jgi:hypothetical protein
VIHHRRDDSGRIFTTVRNEGELTLDPRGLALPFAPIFDAG